MSSRFGVQGCLYLLGLVLAFFTAQFTLQRLLKAQGIPVASDKPPFVETIYWKQSDGQSSSKPSCSSIQQAFEKTKPPASSVIHIQGGAWSWYPSWQHLSTAISFLTEIPDFWGVMLVSSNNDFTIFNNSTAFVEAAATKGNVPNQMIRKQFTDFVEFWEERQPHMFYERESYYFKAAIPSALNISNQLNQPPISCVNQTPQQPGTREASPEGAQLGLRKPFLRLSPKHATHALHYDASDSILVQVSGRKEIRLVHASQLQRIQPYSQEHLFYRRAQIPWGRLTQESSQMYDGLSRRIGVVEMLPGDILFVPARTGHETTTLDPSLSFSMRY